MNCHNCHQSIEAGAAFCGNCGQPLIDNILVPPAAAQVASLPSYSIAVPSQHAAETKALLSVLLGITGIIGALFMALVGLTLGILGVVMGTVSYSSAKRGLSTVGIALSVLAILAGLGVWVYAAQQDSSPDVHSQLAADLSTPCYSIGFVDQLNISNAASSCDMNAYNGQTLASSTNAYKVYANHSNVSGDKTFIDTAKSAIEQDIQKSLPNFRIDNEGATTFAGSPAYVVNVSDKANNIALVEAAVFHKVPTGHNVFILVHANNGTQADLQILESQWRWK